MAGVCEREYMEHSQRDKHHTLTRCHSCGLSQVYVAFWWKSVCGRAYNIKGIMGKFFSFFLKLCFFYCRSFHGMMRADPTVVGGGMQ